MMRLIIIILVTNIFLVSAIFDAEVAKNYFQYRHLSYVSIYGCFSKKEQIEVAKVFNENFISMSLFDISDSKFNISNTHLLMKDNGRLGIALDGSCATSSSFLEQSSYYHIFNDVHFWLVFMERDKISQVFGNLALTISTDLKVVLPNYNETELNVISWTLYDVYNQASDHGGSLRYTFFHVHQNSSGFQPWSLYENLYWRRRNMTGVNFKCMIVLPKNFTGPLEEYIFNDENREVNTFNRFHTVLVFHMRDFYNFSLDMSWTDSWGYILPNGSFDGLVRALQFKIVDFGGSPLFVKNERWPVIDYGRRSWLLRSAFIFRMPKRPASFAVFLRPLDGNVWYLTVVAIVIIVVFMKIILNKEYALRAQDGNNLSYENSWSFLLLITFGALCQQGVTENPVLIATRTIVIYTFLFAFLLYQFYSASIVGFLLMAPTKVIKNVHDLAFSKLKLGVEDVLYNRDYINKLANDPVISSLEKKAINKHNVSFYTSPEIGLKLVAKGGYAFHAEVATAYPLIEETFNEDQVCSLDEVQLFQTQQMHQCLQKHSPFRDMLNHVLQKIDEYGLMKRQLKHWNARKPECIRSRPQTSSVSVEEFYPALSVLVIGISISVIILIIELIIKYKFDKMEEEKMKRRIRKNLRRYN